jgi:UDP-N-acetylmuramate dehydrogenase
VGNCGEGTGLQGRHKGLDFLYFYLKVRIRMIYRYFSLKNYNTFGLNYKADCFITIQSEEEAISVLKNQNSLKHPLLVVGGGSNLLFTRDFEGTIIHPEIEGIGIVEKKDDYVILSSGAGVIWDDLVNWTVTRNFGGLENLSLIPGKVGATPIQNIGAYGVEVKDLIERVWTVSLKNGSIREFNNKECSFGYRESIFKRELKGEYLVTNIWFRLMTSPLLNYYYGSLREEVEKLGPVSQKTIRQAVINIRTSKLPDTHQLGNAGSFFKNPVLRKAFAETFMLRYPEAPFFNDPSGGTKIPAGWLIDQCGWKGKRKGEAGVHDKQALVLVNYGKATGIQILQLSEEIERSVFDKFGISLEREVEVI